MLSWSYYQENWDLNLQSIIILTYILCLIDSVCSDGGLWNCQIRDDCYGRCIISGDPHLQTFDNYRFSFEGQCEYVLMQPHRTANLSQSLYVWIENTKCTGVGLTSCTKTVTIEVHDGQDLIKIRYAKVMDVTLR